MKLKIGDQVKFLSEKGGGKVAGFQGKNVVLVEDEDGFQIPTAITDVILIESEDYDLGNVSRQTPRASTVPDEGTETDPADGEITFRAKPEERSGGDKLSCYLAFVPQNIKQLSESNFDCYIVNDCNYYLRYNYLSAEGNSWKLLASGELEPNTKLFIGELAYADLNDLDRVAVQAIAYKRDKSFQIKPAIDVQLRVNTVKFYKLHAFRENDFFETPALLHTIVENDQTPQPLVVDAGTLKAELYKAKPDHTAVKKMPARQNDDYATRYPGRKKGNPFVIKHKGDDQPLVVDLHINELIDNTNGLSPADILEYQMKKFRDTLEEYKNRKGQKIIFIHGKGGGVLRHSIVNDLNYRYKKYDYQDASFQEFGYGATQVTIR